MSLFQPYSALRGDLLTIEGSTQTLITSAGASMRLAAFHGCCVAQGHGIGVAHERSLRGAREISIALKDVTDDSI